MADIPVQAPAGVTVSPVTQPMVAAPLAQPVVGAPPSAPPVMQAAAPARPSFFATLDWGKVLVYALFTIVAVSYIKYTRDKAKSTDATITDLSSQVASLQTEVDDIKNPPSSGS